MRFKSRVTHALHALQIDVRSQDGLSAANPSPSRMPIDGFRKSSTHPTKLFRGAPKQNLRTPLRQSGPTGKSLRIMRSDVKPRNLK